MQYNPNNGMFTRAGAQAATFDAGLRAYMLGIYNYMASALALTKQQFYQLDGLSFEDGIRLGAQVNAVARATPDFRNAIAQFLKK